MSREYLKKYKVKESPSVKKEEDSEIVQTLKDVWTTLPQGVTTFADEGMAAGKALLGKAAGNKEPISDLYEKNVKGIREDISAARARSPIATTVGEIGAGVSTALLPGVGAGKLGGTLSSMARGAVEGLGSAEDKLSAEGAMSAGLGAGIAGVGNLVQKGINVFSTKEPSAIRASVLGAKSAQFQETGIKDRKLIAEELNKMGLFSNKKVDFDTTSMKFVPRGKSIENMQRPVKENLLSRIDEANSKIQKDKERILKQYSNVQIPRAEFDAAIDEAIDSFARKGTGYSDKAEKANKLAETLRDDLKMYASEMGGEAPGVYLNLKEIEALKNRLSQDVGKYGANPLLKDTPYTDELYQDFYYNVNKLLRNKVPDKQYVKFNETQQKLLTAKSDLLKAIASDEGLSTPGSLPRNYFERAIDKTLMSEENKLGAASTKEFVDKTIPEPIRNALKMGVSEIPYAGIRQLDTSMPAPTFNPGREPQSVSPLAKFGLTKSQVLKTRLPRDTEIIRRNPELFLAKLSQVPGTTIEDVRAAEEVFRNNPLKIKPMIEKSILMHPEMFEDAPFKILDGKILDPAERGQAADLTKNREDLNSIQKAKIISKLNIDGTYI